MPPTTAMMWNRSWGGVAVDVASSVREERVSCKWLWWFSECWDVDAVVVASTMEFGKCFELCHAVTMFLNGI